MFDPTQFDGLAKKLFTTLPSSLQNFENEIQLKFKEVLQTAFAHMDLVTREEFDVQTRVLARTREKVEFIQQQMTELMEHKQNKK